MGKTRVHLLAKELGIETKDLITQLDRLGIRGRKSQSALEDEEVARVRAALAAQEKPQVHVGEEKIVADRMVKTEDEIHGGVEARETVVERRVRANVIRRRVNRVEVASTEPAPLETEAPKPPIEPIERAAEREPSTPLEEISADTVVETKPGVEAPEAPETVDEEQPPAESMEPPVTEPPSGA